RRLIAAKEKEAEKKQLKEMGGMFDRANNKAAAAEKAKEEPKAEEEPAVIRRKNTST
ncbi:hypothetical protein IWW57_002943, partial [Coemansia sp. S610]